MQYLKTLALSAGWLTTIIIFGVTVWKIFIKKWWIRHKEARQKRWTTITQDLKDIKHQVYPNNGGSIIDMQNKVSEQVKEVQYSVGMLTAGHWNILDILDIAAWESDRNGNIVYVTKTLCEMLRCIPSDMLGNSWIGLVAEFDRDRVQREWEKSVRNVSDFDLLYYFELPDGTFQKVNGIAIHNKDKERGGIKSTMGRLIPIDEPVKQI